MLYIVNMRKITIITTLIIAIITVGVFWLFSKDEKSGSNGVLKSRYVDESEFFTVDFNFGFLQGYKYAIDGYDHKEKFKPIDNTIRGGFVFGYSEGWLKGCLEIKKYNCDEEAKLLRMTKESIDYSEQLRFVDYLFNEGIGSGSNAWFADFEEALRAFEAMAKSQILKDNE